MSQIRQETADMVAFTDKIYNENFCALSIPKTKILYDETLGTNALSIALLVSSLYGSDRRSL